LQPLLLLLLPLIVPPLLLLLWACWESFLLQKCLQATVGVPVFIQRGSQEKNSVKCDLL
jgi:hypothetical protein